MVGEHFLISAHHRNTLPQSPFYDNVCGIGIVDKFNNEVDFRVVEYVVGFVGNRHRRVAVFFGVANTGSGDSDIIGVHAAKHVAQALTYVSEAEKTYY